jgi:hypothetical protein
MTQQRFQELYMYILTARIFAMAGAAAIGAQIALTRVK